MNSYRMNISAPNLSCICIDKAEKAEYSGRIYNRYSDEPIPFANTTQLIMTMNQFFDDINYPQSSTIYRSLSTDKTASSEEYSRKTPVPRLTSEWVMDHTGEMGTLFLHVQYRQNSTWQGRIAWLEGDSSELFSSVLELMRMLNQVI